MNRLAVVLMNPTDENMEAFVRSTTAAEHDQLFEELDDSWFEEGSEKYKLVQKYNMYMSTMRTHLQEAELPASHFFPKLAFRADEDMSLADREELAKESFQIKVDADQPERQLMANVMEESKNEVAVPA